MTLLRDDYGWTFVSAGQSYSDMTALTPDQQRAESRGSLQAFTDHGHTRAHGLFAHPQQQVHNRDPDRRRLAVLRLSRTYGRGINKLSEAGAPHLST
jgi:hypothetical protein